MNRRKINVGYVTPENSPSRLTITQEMSPAEYVKLVNNSQAKFKRARIVPPKLGKVNDFGKILVEV
jgi:hypothetical protein